MKALLTAVLVLLVAVPAAFAEVADRDDLLTEQGVLYTVESEAAAHAAEAKSSSRTHLRLTIQDGDETSSMLVPASLNGGSHVSPSLAYDKVSDTLYLFWQKFPTAMASEMIFCSYRDGQWSEPTFIDPGRFVVRWNLKVSVTRYMTTVDDEGNSSRSPMLVAHAVWWEETGNLEQARYAMLTLDKGEVSSFAIRDLSSFIPGESSTEPVEVGDTFDPAVLRHPAIFDRPESDSIDVLFADWHTRRLHLVNLRPQPATPSSDHREGVLQIPIGVWKGETTPPDDIVLSQSQSVSIIRSGSGSSYALYARENDSLVYTVHRKGQWSPAKKIALSDRLTVEMGVDALRKLVAVE